jgi:hypothetical protein
MQGMPYVYQMRTWVKYKTKQEEVTILIMEMLSQIHAELDADSVMRTNTARCVILGMSTTGVLVEHHALLEPISLLIKELSSTTRTLRKTCRLQQELTASTSLGTTTINANTVSRVAVNALLPIPVMFVRNHSK